MAYYDLHVEIENGEEAIMQAKKLGFNGIALINSKEVPYQIALKEGVELINAVAIAPKNLGELDAELASKRASSEIIAVYGGDYETNRAACSDSRVDILFHPEKGRSDSGLDHICVKAAAENGVMIEINFAELLNARIRPREISFLRRNIFLCNEYNAKMIITSGAKNIWEMRPPRDMASVASVLGMSIKDAIDSVSTNLEERIAINREKLKGKRFGEVRVVE